MALFLSTFINKIDRKGRVSVPASFRAELASQRFAGIVLYRALNHAALDGSGMDRLEDLRSRIDALPDFSEEREAFASIFADAQALPFDGEGRILLPPDLAEHAGIALEGSAAFVGLGSTFQIWEPERYRAQHEERRGRARGLTLPPRPAGAAPGGAL